MIARGSTLALAFALLACGADQSPTAPSGSAPAEPSATLAPAAGAGPSASAAAAPTFTSAELALKKASRRLVANELQHDVMIELHVTKSVVPADYLRSFTAVLDHYKRAEHEAPGGGSSQSRVDYRVVDVGSASDEYTAKTLGLAETWLTPWTPDPKPTPTPVIDLRRGFVGLVFKYGTGHVVIPALPPCDPRTLEFFVTNKLREIHAGLSGKVYRFGVVVGKREVGVDEPNLAVGGTGYSLAAVVQSYFPYYVLQGVDLGADERAIDPTLHGLIVTHPSVDYSDAELKRIDQFVMSGGKALAIVASGGTIQPFEPAMRASLSMHGLDKLLAGYGVEMSPGLVYDHDSALELDAISRSGADIKLRHPGIPVVPEARLDRTFPVFWSSKALAFPLASALVLRADRQPEAKLLPLARTSSGAVIISEPGQSMRLAETWPRAGEAAERVLAASVEGTLKSAFSGSDPPKSRTPSRVLVLGSSHVFANPFARAANPAPLPPHLAAMGQPPPDAELATISYPYTSTYGTRAILTFKRTLDWMSGEADFAEVDLPLTDPKK
ncbi:MAG: Gldg family protein [Polyangiaceae bacterium]|nr:Gldg family protein [Polyangiaceae bacterium]